MNFFVANGRNMLEKTDPSDKSQKILFRFYSDVLEKWTVETLWATAVDVGKGWYRLDNIPLFLAGL